MVALQVLGKVPTISVEKTDGCQMFLSEDSKAVEIISAKSSEMNVSIPNGDEFVSNLITKKKFIQCNESKRISKRGSVLKERGGCYIYRFKLYKWLWLQKFQSPCPNVHRHASNPWIFNRVFAIPPPEEIGHFVLVCSALTKHQFHAYQDDQKGFFLRRFKVRPCTIAKQLRNVLGCKN